LDFLFGKLLQFKGGNAMKFPDGEIGKPFDVTLHRNDPNGKFNQDL